MEIENARTHLNEEMQAWRTAQTERRQYEERMVQCRAHTYKEEAKAKRRCAQLDDETSAFNNVLSKVCSTLGMNFQGIMTLDALSEAVIVKCSSLQTESIQARADLECTLASLTKAQEANGTLELELQNAKEDARRNQQQVESAAESQVTSEAIRASEAENTRDAIQTELLAEKLSVQSLQSRSLELENRLTKAQEDAVSSKSKLREQQEKLQQAVKDNADLGQKEVTQAQHAKDLQTQYGTVLERVAGLEQDLKCRDEKIADQDRRVALARKDAFAERNDREDEILRANAKVKALDEQCNEFRNQLRAEKADYLDRRATLIDDHERLQQRIRQLEEKSIIDQNDVEARRNALKDEYLAVLTERNEEIRLLRQQVVNLEANREARPSSEILEGNTEASDYQPRNSL